MNEKIRGIINDPKFVPIVTGVVSLGVGFGVGYILGRKYRKQIHIVPTPKQMNPDELAKWIETQKALQKETEETEEVVVEKTPVVDHSADPMVSDFLAQQLKEEIQSHQGSADPEDAEPVRRSIFAETTNEWDYEEELRHRSKAAPYILHKDEFYGEEMADEGYTQTTMTYYEGDDIMCKQDDTPLYNYTSVVGPLKFGHGSDDPKVFHVRNDRRKEEYEIIHDSGLFSVEVMNLDIEDNDRVKALDKFRKSD